MYGTAQDVINLTGITPSSMGLDEQPDPTVALNQLITTWLERISVAIDVRLGDGTLKSNDYRYKGIVDIAVRTTAKVVACGLQLRTAPVVQVNDFAINVINTSQVIKDLDMELKPYQRRAVDFFSSTK